MKYAAAAPLAWTVLLLLVILSPTPTQVEAHTFSCNARATCQALVDYLPIHATTYSDINTLFGFNNLRSIFGANSLPLSTSPNAIVPARQPTRIPFPCSCTNGVGNSLDGPIYVVKPRDGLDAIARYTFSNLLPYQEIVRVNNISDPNFIEVGQELLIPLPCSCDDVDGSQVVHYGYLVPKGSTVASIADQFNTTESTLLKLNGLAYPFDLMADSVLDVPLRACTSVITNSSLDYPLLVPNGTYTFTANNCVQCKCDSSNDWILQCEPSPEDVKILNWPQCPSMQCEGSSGLSLGNTSFSITCGRITCGYTGYTNQAILTSLITDSNCSTDGGTQPPGDDSTKIGFWWSWTWLFIYIGLGLFFTLGLIYFDRVETVIVDNLFFSLV